MTMAPAPVKNAEAMIARLRAEWNVPLSAGIEISDRCNEVCVHCYQEQGRKGEMTTEQLLGLLDELASMGVLFLTLSGGEATLRKDFLQIVEYARAKGFAIRLFTNGLTMTRELARELGRLAVQRVEISLYSTRPEMHDFVTGVRGSFERTVAGIRNLVEAGVAVTMKTPVMSFNEGELAEYATFAAALGAEFSVSSGELMAREGGDRFPEAFELSERARVEVTREHTPMLSTDRGVQPVAPLSAPPCGAGRSLHIEPNGELRPCTMLELDLGHALREGVSVAYSTNERARELRQLSWEQLHGCRSCDLRAYCSHCYASALAHTGDALGPYLAGCRAALSNLEALSGQPARVQSRGDRDPKLGPFRQLDAGSFEQIDDAISPDDDALAQRLGWARRSSGGLPDPSVVARPGQLVQIRRPGRKQSRLERIPDVHAVGVASSVEIDPSRESIETGRRSNAS